MDLSLKFHTLLTFLILFFELTMDPRNRLSQLSQVGQVVQLSPQVRERLTHLSIGNNLYSSSELLSICTSFRSLTTFNLKSSEDRLAKDFVSLALLTKLENFMLSIKLDDFASVHFNDDTLRPEAVLRSVRSLGLELAIAGHQQISWLNLATTMPNLETIQLKSFSCKRCHISMEEFAEYDAEKRLTALDCFRTIAPLLSSGGRISMSRIYFSTNFAQQVVHSADHGFSITPEKVMSLPTGTSSS